jgi:hypothetical protein
MTSLKWGEEPGGGDNNLSVGIIAMAWLVTIPATALFAEWIYWAVGRFIP